VAFLVGCHAAGAAHPPQPLVGISLPPTPTAAPTANPPATANPPSTATGAAEAQAVAPSGSDDRESAADAVAGATKQIDRLRRIQRAPVRENRESLDAALEDMERARKDVLQDLREVELDPGGQVIRGQLRRHLAELRSALDASYEGWPPIGRAGQQAPRR
jgi:hypothetical protein